MSGQLLVRLTLPILLMATVLLVIGGVTGWYVHLQQQEASVFLSRSVASMRAAEELEIRTRELRTRLNQFVVTGETKYLHVIPEMYGETLEWLGNAETLSRTPHEQQLVTRIRSSFERFFLRFRALHDEARGPNRDLEKLKQQVARLIDDQITADVLLHVHDYLNANQQLISQTIPANQEAADWVGLGLLMLGVCGASAGLLAGYGFSRRMSQSLVQLSVPVHDAAGKLDQVVGPVNLSLTGGNLDELNEALRQVADHIGDVVARLQQSQREALRAEQLAALGQIAAGMAHELRNPLTAIKLLVQAAVLPGATGQLAGADLQVLYEQILRQEKSIQSLLDFARPPKLEPQRFDLADVVHEVLQLITPQARRLRVELESSNVASVELLGDSSQLRQVILNLLVNALDAQPSGGRIEVRLAAVADDRGRSSEACLRVLDSGMGLPPNLGERIFEPFVSSKETGTGLGLSICKRIVELHAGRIGAENRLEGGAQFEVWLPLGPARPPEGPIPMATTAGSQTKPADDPGQEELGQPPVVDGLDRSALGGT